MTPPASGGRLLGWALTGAAAGLFALGLVGRLAGPAFALDPLAGTLRFVELTGCACFVLLLALFVGRPR